VTTRAERGAALIAVLLATTLLTTLGSALILLTTSETLIVSNFRAGVEALYAADAIFERSLVDLNLLVDWNPVLTGVQQSTFTDGAPAGTRVLADSSTIALDQIVNLANCQKTMACSAADMDAVTAARPWGPNNPRWQLYAYGSLSAISAGSSIRSAFYVVALVADDPSENDGDPFQDGGISAAGPNLGAGTILIRCEAFGPRGAHRAIEATLARIDPAWPAATPGVRVLSWREAE
jgi:hypothetical protein